MNGKEGDMQDVTYMSADDFGKIEKSAKEKMMARNSRYTNSSVSCVNLLMKRIRVLL